MKPIKAIILDGKCAGQQMNIEYKPMIKVPLPVENMVGVEGQTLNFDNYETYHEVMRAVDREVVLYSLTGRSKDILFTLTNLTNFIISSLLR